VNKALLGLVSEEMNPRNEKNVAHVEITHPSPLLADVVLIDTPGVGSTHLHNTEMTLRFLPQCDAALFLVSADPPITEVEVEFLEQVREKVARVFFVLNKVDYLSEQERETALAFLRSVLKERLGIEPDEAIFAVSARHALAAKQAGDEALLVASGLPRVTDSLIGFFAREKNRVLREALGRRALDLLSDASLQLGLEMRSLELPITDLEQRLVLFGKKIEEARRQDMLSPDLIDKVLPRASRARRVRARLEREIESLVLCNVENLRWATLQNIDAAFRVFSREIGEELSGTIEATHGAIAAAHRRRNEHAEGITERIGRLRKDSRDLHELIDRLAPLGRRS
jgi:hypothetical protein